MKLLQNYFSSSIGGKEQTYFGDLSCEMTQEEKEPVAMRIPDEPYIPSWRAACDAWVTKKVEDRQGVHTPVYLLYNAYINDNPDDYMDIGQFGKVLRSRFPYRKRRRGKQGQQVYVYQDVALKQEEPSPENPQIIADEKNHVESEAGQSIVVGNVAGGRLLPHSKPVKDTTGATSKVQRSSPKRSKAYQEDDEESHDPSSLCRMAVGRRWIDTNLTSMTGHDTYADDIFKAYLEDHPNEPLTFTSLALLIRGKYPGRRKKINIGQTVKYIYKDLKLNRASQEDVSMLQTGSEGLANPSTAVTTLNDRVSSPPNKHNEQQIYQYVTATSTTTIPSITTSTLRPSVIAGMLPSTSSIVSGVEGRGRLSPRGKSHRAPLPFDLKMRTNAVESYMTSADETKSQVDMNVSEYLANELLDINNLNKTGENYTVSIQVPGSEQFSLPQTIPSALENPSVFVNYVNSSRGKAKGNPMLSKHPKYRKRSIPEPYSLPHVSIPYSSNPLIPSVVSEMTQEGRMNRKRSWDYGAQGNTSPEPHRSWDSTLRKSISPELNMKWGQMESEGLHTMPSEKRERMEFELQTVQDLHDTRLAPDAITDEGTMTAINTPMNNLSIAGNTYTTANTHKSICGSPTSSSPPGAAMHRLAFEIVTSTPQVGEPSELSAIDLSTTTRGESKSSSNTLDGNFKETIKSVISAARAIPMASGQDVELSVIMRNMESAIFEENPAVSYDSFDCHSLPALKDLEHTSPEHAVELIRHHQSCSGLGCTNECQVLRAAYIHLVIFRHKCSIWESFSKIIAKHARRCRILSCDVEFCHFVKHELHLSGVSVLPMQLFKERPSLEEAFRKCEELGTHEGELHCCQFPVPKLPIYGSPVRQLQEGQSFSDSEQSSTLFQAIVSAFPDTPSGNAVGMHVVKTLNLLKDLFKKFPNVR